MLSIPRLEHQLEIFHDQNKNTTLDEILQLKTDNWKTIDEMGHTLRITDNTYWVRFTIDNKALSNQQIVLEQNYPVIDTLDLYILNNNQLNHINASGLKLPYSHRAIPFHMMK